MINLPPSYMTQAYLSNLEKEYREKPQISRKKTIYSEIPASSMLTPDGKRMYAPDGTQLYDYKGFRMYGKKKRNSKNSGKVRKSQRKSNKRHSKYAGTIGRFSRPYCPGTSEYRDPDAVDELINDNEKLCQDDKSYFVISNESDGAMLKRLWVDGNGHVINREDY